MKAADGTPIAERWVTTYGIAQIWDNEPVLMKAIEELSAAEERERVLREAAEKAKWALFEFIDAWPTCLSAAQRKSVLDAHGAIESALATPAPEQPAQPSAEKAGNE